MHFRRLVALAGISALTLLAGCGSTTRAAAGSPAPASQTVAIHDLAGRQVRVPAPANIHRVLAIHPIPTFFVWRLAPKDLVSVDMVFRSSYLLATPHPFSAQATQQMLKLPVTGVFFKGLSKEQLLKLHPNVIFDLNTDPNIAGLQSQLGIPIVAIAKAPLNAYEQTIRLVGQVVGNTTVADRLANMWQQIITQVRNTTAGIPAARRPRVYLANGSLLETPGKNTVMGSVIQLAGGTDVSNGVGNPKSETVSVDMEQILRWNPQIVIVTTPALKTDILSNPAWQSISAVRNHRIYVENHLAYIDGPTAVMGLLWAEGEFYHPSDHAFQAAFDQQMSTFYQLFFRHNYTPTQIQSLVPLAQG